MFEWRDYASPLEGVRRDNQWAKVRRDSLGGDLRADWILKAMPWWVSLQS